MFDNPIPISPEGRGILEVSLKPLQDVTLMPIEFKLDTGADVTTISKSTLNDLGYSNDWIATNAVKSTKMTLESAGFEKKPSCYVVMPTVNVHGKDFTNWWLYILPDKLDYPNLLGLDILRYFNFAFDYVKWEFELVPIDKPERTRELAENQKVYNVDIKET
ncbi:MAG: retroviral-like aspartic protease family protein [Firmicutes bacterium]|nr:retroviral-like aspartic protease family protein [Bacillota bacterium]